jgi:hypothetical protein
MGTGNSPDDTRSSRSVTILDVPGWRNTDAMLGLFRRKASAHTAFLSGRLKKYLRWYSHNAPKPAITNLTVTPVV